MCLLKARGNFLVFALLSSIAFLMDTLVNCFPLAIYLHKSFWAAKIAKFIDFPLKVFKSISIFRITIQETIYNFYQLQFNFSHTNLFNSSYTSKEGSTGLQCFCFLERAPKTFFNFFLKTLFNCDVGHPVQFSASFGKVRRSLHNIKQNFGLGTNSFTISILKSMYKQSTCQYVLSTHVRTCEADCSCRNSSASPSK